jgi:hypothetical protein
MEDQNKRAITEEDARMSELEPAQLAEITGGFCDVIINGHLVGPHNVPGRPLEL